MQKNIKGTSMEITPAIADYIEKKFSAFDRFVTDDGALCEVEVGKTTHHHRGGDFFKAEVNLRSGGNNFYAVAEKDDLYASIDEVKDDIVRQIKGAKDRSHTLYRRGALAMKNILKGLDVRKRFKKGL